MYITQFQVKNYKSFYSSEELNLVPGFNVIIGQNNVGKTALIEAISLHFDNKSHRSMKTIPRLGMPSPAMSTVNIAFQLSEGEIEEVLINTANNFYVPIKQGAPTFDNATKFQELLRHADVLRCVFEPSVEPNGNFTSAYLDTYGAILDTQTAVLFSIDSAQHKLINNAPTIYNINQSNPSSYGNVLAKALRRRIYIFKAERMNVSTSAFGMETILRSDAQNLAEVLHNLQASYPNRFTRFNHYVNIVFPEIKCITVPSYAASHVQILVWSIDPATDRADLAMPLSESGTGIGQVLAILYVVLTAEYPQIIIIDEPQSFLHPGAVRKLIEILKQYTQHQLIITTHSPEVVSVVNLQALFLLRKVEAETSIEQLDNTEAKDQKILLSEVGARLSDVFGADNILWVEGATEELCFPLIVEKVLRKPLRGTKIIGVVQTGDFESKHSELILQIYNRLSKGSGLIPPAIGFILDLEGRSQQNQDDLIRRSQGSVIFLPRRMYENYLLNPQTIASVVSGIKGFRDTPIASEEVEKWIQSSRLDKKYYDSHISESVCTGDKWRQSVHGAKLLEDFFKQLSEGHFYYDKTEYGLAFTEWIVNNAPNDLEEVAKVIESKLQSTS